MSGFEGSYLGAADRISPQAIMECKVCWTPYDPAEGDATRQIDPGTPFAALPSDWSCPTCSAPAEQFMVLEDPGAADLLEANRISALTARLVDDFNEVWHSKMRDVPLVNKALRVEAVGFRAHEGQVLGVLVSPWFMNLILLPDGQTWELTAGEKEVIAFPSGDYEFIHNARPLTGPYKACSLFSPMGDFTRQKDAVEVAEAVMLALFDPENQAETDRAADIRAAREAEAEAEAEAAAAEAPEEPPVPILTDRPSRRSVLTAGLATGETTA
ncbi:[NiFe]-hydrogenase assembly chaperone HybE [Pseudooceanicola sp. CBS1P-1]|uniref:[NiFe]-hydrogenase assembly chaperone HybE n=1 Tax=Pseudooceanicola albus TaxID=2692189 RepID=A0A6L7G7X2_9RHOB|nr:MULTISPECIES: [NiFe]-hydrogenase assembly chaperone HybE [Pseudooceanicola]MBT9384204.1 [NiFe]-hydrogenase assembly chaperone HybE [Pseudooceanicola endophyticus]MXN19697.1 [NiFe]-hydrogenase assembly chaperone HybE [Pseudooceanicola albus]